MNKQILKLAFPSILANITIPIVGLVDMAIAGHIADAAAIGGIAIGTMLFDLLYWNFGFLRVGTSGMTAQAYGRGDMVECAGQLTHALEIALGGAFLILLIQWGFVSLALDFVPCSDQAAEAARQYFLVRVWAAPATLSMFALKGWFIGMQDTISPMICDIIINVVNVIASYGLAVMTPLGVVGVAYGTVIAQFTGLLAASVILLTKYRAFFRILDTTLYDLLRSFDKRIFVMNRDLFIRSLCFMVIYIGYTSLSSRYGDEALAASSLVMKLFMLFSYFIDGFAYAGEALIGKTFGRIQIGLMDAQNREIGRLVWRLMLWCGVVAVGFTLVFLLWGTDLMHLLWPGSEQTLMYFDYRPWLIAMPLLAAPAFMWDGIYVGATAGKDIRNGMIISAIAFVITYVLLQSTCGILAVMFAYFAHLIARDIYLTLLWRRTYVRQIGQPPLEGVGK